METLLEFKCPSCGGALQFDAETQKLKCPYCDTEFETDALNELENSKKSALVDDMNWAEGKQENWHEGEQENLVCYICQSCGGEIITDVNTAATTCPFCGNSVIMAKQLEGCLRPDCIFPFKLDKQAAEEALKKHFKGKLLLPKSFQDENHIKEIKGVYVPFWLFDAEADGDAHFHATRVRTWADSRYTYRETKHFSIYRSGTLRFRGIPVDGSSKMANDLMESLEPYDNLQTVDFHTAYLAGYYADKYDVSAQKCAPRANERIRESMQQTLEKTVLGYTTVVPEHTGIRLRNNHSRYTLYPVWLLHTNYRGQGYLFAMNGQTGKLVGNLPMDKGAYWKWWFAVFAIASALSGLIAYLIGNL